MKLIVRYISPGPDGSKLNQGYSNQRVTFGMCFLTVSSRFV